MCLYNLLLRGGSSTACLRPRNSIFDQKTGHFWPFFHEKMANFGAYACLKWIFRDLSASTTCFFCIQHPQIRGGVFNYLSEAKKLSF